MSEKRKRLKQGSAIRSILISNVTGLLSFILMTSLAALIITKSNVDLNKLSFILFVIVLLSSFIAALISAYINKEMKGLIIGLVTSALFTFVVFVAIFIINNALISGIAYIAICLSAIIGIPAGIIGANLK